MWQLHCQDKNERCYTTYSAVTHIVCRALNLPKGWAGVVHSSLVTLASGPESGRPPIWDASNQFPRIQYLKELDDYLTLTLGVMWKLLIFSLTPQVRFITTTNPGQQMAVLGYRSCWSCCSSCNDDASSDVISLLGIVFLGGGNEKEPAAPPPLCCHLGISSVVYFGRFNRKRKILADLNFHSVVTILNFRTEFVTLFSPLGLFLFFNDSPVGS